MDSNTRMIARSPAANACDTTLLPAPCTSTNTHTHTQSYTHLCLNDSHYAGLSTGVGCGVSAGACCSVGSTNSPASAAPASTACDTLALPGPKRVCSTWPSMTVFSTPCVTQPVRRSVSCVSTTVVKARATLPATLRRHVVRDRTPVFTHTHTHTHRDVYTYQEVHGEPKDRVGGLCHAHARKRTPVCVCVHARASAYVCL